jgi:hypothetical protein
MGLLPIPLLTSVVLSSACRATFTTEGVCLRVGVPRFGREVFKSLPFLLLSHACFVAGNRTARCFLHRSPSTEHRAGLSSVERGDDGSSAAHTPITITTITTTHTIYFLDYIESVGVGRRATYLSGGGLCAGLYYVTLYALVIHLIGIKSIIIITTWGYALIICHPRWRPVIT